LPNTFLQKIQFNNQQQLFIVARPFLSPGPTMPTQAELFSNRARECEKLAARCRHSAAKSNLLKLAEYYRKLSKQAAPNARLNCNTAPNSTDPYSRTTQSAPTTR
jgi:hypothetical protein